MNKFRLPTAILLCLIGIASLIACFYGFIHTNYSLISILLLSFGLPMLWPKYDGGYKVEINQITQEEFDNKQRFKNGCLYLNNARDLVGAELFVNPQDVNELHIGAYCLQSYPTQELLNRLARYTNLHLLTVDDDLIEKGHECNVKNDLVNRLNPKRFQWAQGSLIEGKYGRFGW